MTKRISLLLLLVILLIGGAFRFYLIKEIPLGLAPEEAMYGNYALQALSTGDVRLFYPGLGSSTGIFVNLLALTLKVLGNAPWALRLVSALVGTMTILGVYLLARELFSNHEEKSLALLASFFLATSFWHISFSRLAFSIVLLPLFGAFALYFLLRGLYTGRVGELAFAGVLAGLGFYASNLFYTMLPVFALPLGRTLWHWYRRKDADIATIASNVSRRKNTVTEDVVMASERSWARLACGPCATMLFLFVMLVVLLPMLVHVLQGPEVIAGAMKLEARFAVGAFIRHVLTSGAKTLEMFFLRGDCDWRYNLNCQPALHGIVGFFAVVGLVVAAFGLVGVRGGKWFVSAVLITWLVAALLPLMLGPQHSPDALRALGAIIPIMLIAAFGAVTLLKHALCWFEARKSAHPERSAQLLRIQREITVVLPLLLLIIPLQTHRAYFIDWAYEPQTYDALATPLAHMGQYLNATPPEATKYVVANMPSAGSGTLPAPLHTVLFITNTFSDRERTAKHFVYLVSGEKLSMIARDKPAVIVLLNGYDWDFIAAIKTNLPEFKLTVPGDFLAFRNF